MNKNKKDVLWTLIKDQNKAKRLTGNRKYTGNIAKETNKSYSHEKWEMDCSKLSIWQSLQGVSWIFLYEQTL